jgi:glutamate dehydrogenase/leucine dehydrogenase
MRLALAPTKIFISLAVLPKDALQKISLARTHYSLHKINTPLLLFADSKYTSLTISNRNGVIMDILNLSPTSLSKVLTKQNIKRFYFVYNRQAKTVQPSHDYLQPIADYLNKDQRDFNAHEGLFFQVDPLTDTLFGAFVHWTNRGQGAGGLRYWGYDTTLDFIQDGIRLAEGMTRKNALAGLWWGGGKGIMARNPEINEVDTDIRTHIYREYGKFVTSLQGVYVTAEDVGTNVEDMANVFSQTRFTTCIPFTKGGSGNPSVPTARGVVSGMEAAQHYLGHDSLEGVTVAIQGAGNVGRPLMEFLFAKNVGKIIVHDISKVNIDVALHEFAGHNLEAKVVRKDDISLFAEECDILAPCATGAILNAKTIPLLKAKIICGASNNQLEDAERDGHALHERGIIYVPDFLTNRMGIVNCANEQYGYVNNDQYFERHLGKEWEHSVYQTTMQVLRQTQQQGLEPAKAAIKIADKLARENHPIFGHRGQQIIDTLVANHWEAK